MASVSIARKKLPGDESQADWYQIMADDGHDLDLGTAEREIFNYSFDCYIKESYDNAYQGFQELAEKGSAASQYFLGAMYLQGCGVLQDFIRAHFWFNIAAASGHRKARLKLEDLTYNMSVEQVAEAQKLAREWVEANHASSDQENNRQDAKSF